jgi:hypothetical protein
MTDAEVSEIAEANPAVAAIIRGFRTAAKRGKDAPKSPYLQGGAADDDFGDMFAGAGGTSAPTLGDDPDFLLAGGLKGAIQEPESDLDFTPPPPRTPTTNVAKTSRLLQEKEEKSEEARLRAIAKEGDREQRGDAANAKMVLTLAPDDSLAGETAYRLHAIGGGEQGSVQPSIATSNLVGKLRAAKDTVLPDFRYAGIDSLPGGHFFGLLVHRKATVSRFLLVDEEGHPFLEKGTGEHVVVSVRRTPPQ